MTRDNGRKFTHIIRHTKFYKFGISTLTKLLIDLKNYLYVTFLNLRRQINNRRT